MAAQGHGQLFTGNAAAIVFYGNQAHTAREQAYGDLGGTSVQGVIDQLTHDRGRAFDHLTCRNLADQLIGQVLDGTAGKRGGMRDIHPGDSMQCGCLIQAVRGLGL